MASGRCWSVGETARYTAPNPPAPISSTSRYGVPGRSAAAGYGGTSSGSSWRSERGSSNVTVGGTDRPRRPGRGRGPDRPLAGSRRGTRRRGRCPGRRRPGRVRGGCSWLPSGLRPGGGRPVPRPPRSRSSGLRGEPLPPPLDDSPPEQVDGLLDRLSDGHSGDPADRPAGQRPGAPADDRDHALGREVQEHVPPLLGFGHDRTPPATGATRVKGIRWSGRRILKEARGAAVFGSVPPSSHHFALTPNQRCRTPATPLRSSVALRCPIVTEPPQQFSYPPSGGYGARHREQCRSSPPIIKWRTPAAAADVCSREKCWAPPDDDAAQSEDAPMSAIVWPSRTAIAEIAPPRKIAPPVMPPHRPIHSCHALIRDISGRSTVPPPSSPNRVGRQDRAPSAPITSRPVDPINKKPLSWSSPRHNRGVGFSRTGRLYINQGASR